MSISESSPGNEKNEISLEERRVIEGIEKLKTSDHTKATIMLIWKGLKPAAEFDFADYDTEDESDRQEQTLAAEKLFADLKLFSHKIQEQKDVLRYEANGKDPTPGKFYRDSYYLAKNSNDLEYLVDHFGKEENSEITEKLGTILGYPSSAIDAWNTEDRSVTILDTELEQPELFARDEMAFAEFRFSKSNWQKEFEVVKKWADEVKRLDPLLYGRIVSQYHYFLADKDSE